MEDRYTTIITIALTLLLSSYGSYANESCSYASDPSGTSNVCNPKLHDCIQFYEKVLDYQKKLEPYYKKVMSKHILSPSDAKATMKIINEYYSFIANNKIAYGNLAKDMVNNNGAFARIGNNHLVHRAKEEGKSEVHIKDIVNNLRVSLAYTDTKLRLACTKTLPYKAIANYHYNMFEHQGLSKLAWGGFLFEEFAGTGSWMNVGGYDNRPKFELKSLVEAISVNREVNGIKARDAFRSVKYIPLQRFGDSVIVSTYRALMAIKPKSKVLDGNFSTFDDHKQENDEYSQEILFIRD